MTRPWTLGRLLVLLTVACWRSAAPAAAQVDEARFRADLRHVAAAPSRLVGSPGYDAAVAYVEGQLRGLPNVEVRRQDFPVMVPVTRSATLATDAGTDPVLPFWPAQVRVNATPAGGIAGRLVYAGECHPADLRPASLSGQIAVVEASAGERWVEPFKMGARAELVLGTDRTSWADLKSDDLRIPVNLPRFYVPPGRLADRLRSGTAGSGVVRAGVAWEPRTATNLIALVRGTGPGPAGALLFSVPLDATSLVPDLAPGAGQAVQTAAGLSVLRTVAAHPWRRPVAVFFGSADGMQFQGTRNLLLAIATAPATYADELADLAARRAAAEADLTRAGRPWAPRRRPWAPAIRTCSSGSCR